MEKTQIAQAITSSLIDLSEVKQSSAEVPDPTLSWSEADKAWLKLLPPIMQQVAGRHGKKLYLLAVCSRNFNEGTDLILRRNGGNREITRCVNVMASAFQAIAGLVEEDVPGLSKETFQAAFQDVDRAVKLMTVATSSIPS